MDFADACRKAKFRNSRRYVRDRVWRWLKRQPHPIRVAEAVAALGMSDRAVINALSRLREGGHAKRTGNTHRSRWVAVGDEPPKDSRGFAVNSIKNLVYDWQNSLPKANIACGRPEYNVALMETIKGRRGRSELVPIPSLAELLGVD